MTPALRDVLEVGDIQGNILQAYRMPCAAYLSVHVGDAVEGRRLLADLRSAVTDARPWARKPPTTLNVAVSYEGLRALGLSERVLETFPSEFRDGMEARWKLLDDTGPSAPEHWEQDLRGGRVHFLLIVHARSRSLLDDEIARIGERVWWRRGLTLGRAQIGQVLDSPDGIAREHFGFADGSAQPAIAGSDGPQYPGQGVPRTRRERVRDLAFSPDGRWRPLAAGEFVLGYHDEDGVLPEAPTPPFGRNGTFVVYRKLAQNVAAFRCVLRSLAREHWSDDEALAAAKILGRWQDGTPVALSPQRSDPQLAADRARVNDFRFSSDAEGRACPIGAHVRRANPREGLVGGAIRTRRHRIIRRSIPYGQRLPPGTEDDEQRGLIFVCLNASILRQFEVVNRWLHDGNAFGLGDERDYVTAAREDRGDTMLVQSDPPLVLRPHPPLVWTRGGEYLFMPGVAALDALADVGALPKRRVPVGT